jgi:hypothetical protein
MKKLGCATGLGGSGLLCVSVETHAWWHILRDLIIRVAARCRRSVYLQGRALTPAMPPEGGMDH